MIARFGAAVVVEDREGRGSALRALGGFQRWPSRWSGSRTGRLYVAGGAGAGQPTNDGKEGRDGSAAGSRPLPQTTRELPALAGLSGLPTSASNRSWSFPSAWAARVSPPRRGTRPGRGASPSAATRSACTSGTRLRGSHPARQAAAGHVSHRRARAGDAALHEPHDRHHVGAGRPASGGVGVNASADATGGMERFHYRQTPLWK